MIKQKVVFESYIDNKTETVIAQECTTTENNNADEYIDDYIDDYSNEEELTYQMLKRYDCNKRRRERGVSQEDWQKKEKVVVKYYTKNFNTETIWRYSKYGIFVLTGAKKLSQFQERSAAVSLKMMLKEFETETANLKMAWNIRTIRRTFADEIVSERKYDNIEINDNQGIDGPAEGAADKQQA